jgi:NCAIR mutase (PurE)-related protein
METREILEQVKSGTMSVEEAEGHFRRQPFEDLGFAKLDMHRKIRSCFPEVIFCKGKPDAFLVSIYKRMVEEEGKAFGTRASK